MVDNKWLKGSIWRLLDQYLQHPGQDKDGGSIKIYYKDTHVLTREMTNRLNITNALAEVRDKGIISWAEYYYLKFFYYDEDDLPAEIVRKYNVPQIKNERMYKAIMGRACEAMIPIIYSKESLAILQAEA